MHLSKLFLPILYAYTSIANAAAVGKHCYGLAMDYMTCRNNADGSCAGGASCTDDFFFYSCSCPTGQYVVCSSC
jgi:hypothetical protein